MNSTPLTIARFDPAPFCFPKPRVPLLPTRSPGESICHPAPVSPELQRHFRSFTHGRYALREAYRLSGIGTDATLMAPAYHCVTMLDPAVSLGADVVLYPLDTALAPDMEHLETAFARAQHPVKALLATHFFGFIQDFTALKAWCDVRDIVLIEDCSHVLFNEIFQAPGAGHFGRYVTSSPYKFIACDDGGYLYSSDPHGLHRVNTAKRSLLDEVRGLKHIAEKRRTARPAPEIYETAEELKTITNIPLPSTELHQTAYTYPSLYYQTNDIGKSALRSSRRLVHATPTKPLTESRLRNYAHWLNAISTMPSCRALYPELPEDCIPYMFPLLIEHPNPHFFWLKRLGVPIWRWDELAMSNCEVAQHSQLHLLHLPCHQGLDTSQIEWMTDTMRMVMALKTEKTP